MAPEQARDCRDADERSDIYSLGCTMFYLLTGRHCYSGKTSLDQILAHHNQPIPDLESLHSAVPESLERVFRRMLAKRPDDRYASVAELITDLASCDSENDTTSVGESIIRVTGRTSATGSMFETYNARPLRLSQRQYLTLLTAGLAACLLFIPARNYFRTDTANSGGLEDAAGNVSGQIPGVRDETESGSEPPVAVAPFDEMAAKKLQQTWAAWMDIELQIHDANIGVDLVLIPPGEFQMGSSEKEVNSILMEFGHEVSDEYHIGLLRSESPVRRVTISRPFYMASTEVTLDQFRRFIDATGYVTEAEKNDQGLGLRNGEWTRQQGEYFNWHAVGDANDLLTDAHPVGNISWNDAVAYCHWCSRDGIVYRLPTEAEWEYACRAGTKSRWSWGDHSSVMHEYSNIADNSNHHGRPFPAPVGLRRANSFGLHDMHGNLAEFCRDWFTVDAYSNALPETDPSGPNHRTPPSEQFGNTRVFRGGGASNTLVTTRSASRAAVNPDDPGGNTCTIRLLREIPVKWKLE